MLRRRPACWAAHRISPAAAGPGQHSAWIFSPTLRKAETSLVAQSVRPQPGPFAAPPPARAAGSLPDWPPKARLGVRPRAVSLPAPAGLPGFSGTATSLNQRRLAGFRQRCQSLCRRRRAVAPARPCDNPAQSAPWGTARTNTCIPLWHEIFRPVRRAIRGY